MLEDADGSLAALLDLHALIYRLDHGHWVKFKAYRIEPTRQIPHGIFYALTLHYRSNRRVFGIDNVHAFIPEKRKYVRAKNDLGPPA